MFLQTAMAIPSDEVLSHVLRRDLRDRSQIKKRFGMLHSNDADITTYPYTVSTGGHDASVNSVCILIEFKIFQQYIFSLDVTFLL